MVDITKTTLRHVNNIFNKINKILTSQNKPVKALVVLS